MLRSLQDIVSNVRVRSYLVMLLRSLTVVLIYLVSRHESRWHFAEVLEQYEWWHESMWEHSHFRYICNELDFFLLFAILFFADNFFISFFRHTLLVIAQLELEHIISQHSFQLFRSSGDYHMLYGSLWLVIMWLSVLWTRSIPHVSVLLTYTVAPILLATGLFGLDVTIYIQFICGMAVFSVCACLFLYSVVLTVYQDFAANIVTFRNLQATHDRLWIFIINGFAMLPVLTGISGIIYLLSTTEFGEHGFPFAEPLNAFVSQRRVFPGLAVAVGLATSATWRLAHLYIFHSTTNIDDVPISTDVTCMFTFLNIVFWLLQLSSGVIRSSWVLYLVIHIYLNTAGSQMLRTAIRVFRQDLATGAQPSLRKQSFIFDVFLAVTLAIPQISHWCWNSSLRPLSDVDSSYTHDLFIGYLMAQLWSNAILGGIYIAQLAVIWLERATGSVSLCTRYCLVAAIVVACFVCIYLDINQLLIVLKLFLLRITN